MRSTIEDVRRDIAGLASAMRRVAIAVTGVDARLIRVEQFAHKELVTRSEFNARMDGLAGALEDAKLHWAHQAHRTDDIVKRVSKLESRPH